MAQEPETGASDAAHADQAAAEIGDGAGDLELAGAELADLVAGSPGVAIGDVLAVAAELDQPERRGRGRPPGSPNRKNADMIAYLQARGHRDPWHTLSLIQSAGTMSLAKALGSPMFRPDGTPILERDGTPAYAPADPVKVLAIQKAAAEAILPYHHAKQPTQLGLELPAGEGYRRPVMAIGELNVTNVMIGETAAMSIHDAPGKIVEHQRVSEADSVRPEEGESHDAPEALRDKALSDKST